MATETLATQYDPQYGWVVADPKASGDFLGFQKAQELYNTLYEPTYNRRGRQTNAINQAYLSFDGRNPYQTNIFDFGQQGQTQRDPGEDLMRWYLSASNQDLMNDPIAREIILAQGQQFSRDPWQQQYSVYGQQQATPKQYQVSGQRQANPMIETALSKIRKQYGRDAFRTAMDAVNMAQYREPTQSTTIYDIANPSLADYSSKTADTLRNALRTEGSVDFQRLMQSNPLFYENAALTRYTDGPNVSLVSRDGGPFTTYHRHSNISRTMGGEDLADDVFQYYQNRATQGLLGNEWNPVEGNQYVTQGLFNDAQAYFTPYQYAIHGIPVGEGRQTLTNISSLSPEFWEAQGNLQRIGDNWGFVTSTNPFAQGGGVNQQVAPETVKFVEKTSGGGLLDSGVMSLLTTGAQFLAGGANPLTWGLGAKALGWPSLLSSASGLLEGSGSSPRTWRREVIAPQWNRQRV